MRIAFLTAGGIAPCLTASIGFLIKEYNKINKKFEFIGYLNGYKGLLQGDYVKLNDFSNIDNLNDFGGSLLGSSRVKLTNIDDCIKNNYINKNQIPLETAAQELIKNKIDILHTIGGDDTNTTAADLVKYLEEKKYKLTIVGLPKTIDNDVYPIQQTLGAFTAAEQTSNFFKNIVNENTTSSRHLIIHEIMGRNCGWLTAATAQEYRNRMRCRDFLPSILIDKDRWDVDAIYIPEEKIDVKAELQRLESRMNEKDSVNIFLSEGAGIDSIIFEMENKGEVVKRDAFGHVRLDEINPGQWFVKQFSKGINAHKILVQKSGYFARSAKPNKKDLDLIFQTADLAIECAIDGESGVVGLDEDRENQLRCIEFERIKGGKPFNPLNPWFQSMLKEIGQ